jgi:hypothetical protein
MTGRAEVIRLARTGDYAELMERRNSSNPVDSDNSDVIAGPDGAIQRNTYPPWVSVTLRHAACCDAEVANKLHDISRTHLTIVSKTSHNQPWEGM